MEEETLKKILTVVKCLSNDVPAFKTLEEAQVKILLSLVTIINICGESFNVQNKTNTELH
jgi:hypothetical protein